MNQFVLTIVLFCKIILLSAVPGASTTIPTTNEAGDFMLVALDNVSQSGPLVVAGRTSISGGDVTLDRPDNDFNPGAANVFFANGSLTVTDTSDMRGTFQATGNANVMSAGTLIVDSLDIDGNADILAFGGGSDFFDVIVRDAQNIFVGGTLSIVAESILFEFTDNKPADLSRLSVGELLLLSNDDSIVDTTVLSGGVSVTGSIASVVPLPGAFSLLLTAFVPLILRRKPLC